MCSIMCSFFYSGCALQKGKHYIVTNIAAMRMGGAYVYLSIYGFN